MNTVFIYALNCPITGRTRYVGKAKDVYRRLRRHKFDSKTTNNHRANWLRGLFCAGLCPVVEILDEVPESEWQQWEVAYIQFFRENGFDLTNGNEGGEGGLANKSRLGKPHTPETREKLRLAHTGKTLTAEHCAHMSAARKGKFLGRKHSEETRANMRIVALKRKHDPHSSGTREKISVAKKLWWKKKKEHEKKTS